MVDEWARLREGGEKLLKVIDNALAARQSALCRQENRAHEFLLVSWNHKASKSDSPPWKLAGIPSFALLGLTPDPWIEICRPPAQFSLPGLA